MNTEYYLGLIKEKYLNLTENLQLNHEMIFVNVKQDKLLELLILLRNDGDLSFKILTDISAIDYPERSIRFEILYNLLSLKINQRLLIKVAVSEHDVAPSSCDIFMASNWYEREIWDMFGISFDNHPDLRRILTDYGFEGHPLRKDFPLTGRVEVRYDQTQQKVIYEPVKLTQEYRNFEFMSPWQGTNYQLPGDES